MKLMLIASLLVLFLDQLTKYFLKDKTFILTSFLNIDYVENTGAAFGILKGFNLLFIIIACAVLFLIFYYREEIRKEKFCFRLAAGFLIGGILGNLVDRLFLGYVRDFVAFNFWPTFNVADSFSTVAVVILIFYMLTSKKLCIQ